MRLRSLGLLYGLVLAATLAPAGTVTGTAAYRERIAAPPDAVFEARLLDTSRADAPASVLGSFRREAAGNPPYAFSIAYYDAAIQPSRRYVVRATLSDLRGQLLFTTDSAHAIRFDGSVARPLPPLRLVSARGRGAGPLGALPASFEGEIPGDGGAVRWQLELMADGRFQSRQTFVGQPEPNRFDDIGRWQRRGSVIELRGTREERPLFEPAAGGALRKLDREGQRIVSAGGHNDLLARRPQTAPIEPRVVATGMFRYFADAPSIVLCADGRTLPVAMAGDYLALERAYSAADKAAPGQPLLVSFDGSIAPRRSAEESRGAVPTLVVQRFGKVWPRESCGTPLADSPLAETYWKLVRLNGDPVTAAANQREPHLLFRRGPEARVAGSSGCNRVMGGYTLDGEQLRLSKMAGTRMACPDGMAQERAFLDALTQVDRWQVRGSHLELSDAQRRVLARFEAVALR
jgi:copper homeostasis protein (lipoprotein)